MVTKILIIFLTILTISIIIITIISIVITTISTLITFITICLHGLRFGSLDPKVKGLKALGLKNCGGMMKDFKARKSACCSI